MITLKLGTPEWYAVWDAVSAFVENGRADSDECCKRLKAAEGVMQAMDEEMAALAPVPDADEPPPVVKRRAPIKVFVTVYVVKRRFVGDPDDRRYSAKLTARGSWTEMYRSKPCATREAARELAAKYLAKNADWLVLDGEQL